MSCCPQYLLRCINFGYEASIQFRLRDSFRPLALTLQGVTTIDVQGALEDFPAPLVCAWHRDFAFVRRQLLETALDADF
ncbi:hypothetical protein WL88_28160 [Burkholderia diffusa]|uniref:Uncharacterized protein n=1 Tax=Burkholderia diffusa TaxID=488732 RepID=A0AAW3P7V1_9BURK|nr:hypothetical protein WL85_06850 [Burkholderia diffusa]KWF44839.1 hypothetical protein WL87_23600 [Burkholderia diffusa]KWF45433.1 hypothetical protein WL88_28160 [Burkholderia diffusa]